MAKHNGHSLPLESVSFSISLPQWQVDLIEAEMREKLIDKRSPVIANILKEYFERTAEAKLIKQAKENGMLRKHYQETMDPSCE